MSTAAQLAANRANAQHSSGPTSEAGKAASSQNHLDHGFASMFRVMPDEEYEKYTQLLADFTAEWSPAGPTESALVKTLAESHWLASRAMRLHQVAFRKAERADATTESFKNLERLARYQVQFDRSFQRTINSLLRLRAERRKEQIGFELAKQRAAAETARQKPAELKQEPVQPAITKPERDLAPTSPNTSTTEKMFEALKRVIDANGLPNAPAPGLDSTETGRAA
jgi:hypothetical protein